MHRLTIVLVFLLSTASLLASDVAGTGLVIPQHSTSRLLIPAAGALQGDQGTFFRSDIRITNLGDSEQLVEMIWLPREGWPAPPQAGGEGGIMRRTLQVYEMLHSDDFVTEILGTSGLGAILVSALLPDGSDVDPDGKLQASSRIWSPQPGAPEGTVSQSLPAIPLTAIVHENALILGHRRDEDFRTNVGIVNLDNSGTWAFRVTVSGENPTLVPEIYEVSVPPYGISLIPVMGVEQTRMRIDVEVVPSDTGVLTLWLPFASTVDNRTGDAWSTVGFESPR